MVTLSMLLAVGCSRPDATGPRGGSGTDFASGPVSIAKASGTDQNGEAGRPLSQPFEVIVLDDVGDGVPNIRVTWSVRSGGGELSRDTTFTDSGGHAESLLILGPATGKQTVRAAAAGGAPFPSPHTS